MGMEVKRKIQLRAGEATIKNISLCRDERNKELSGFTYQRKEEKPGPQDVSRGTKQNAGDR
jgi:hypothetical protein